MTARDTRPWLIEAWLAERREQWPLLDQPIPAGSCRRISAASPTGGSFKLLNFVWVLSNSSPPPSRREGLLPLSRLIKGVELYLAHCRAPGPRPAKPLVTTAVPSGVFFKMGGYVGVMLISSRRWSGTDSADLLFGWQNVVDILNVRTPSDAGLATCPQPRPTKPLVTAAPRASFAPVASPLPMEAC